MTYTTTRVFEDKTRKFSVREMIVESLGRPVLGNKELDEVLAGSQLTQGWKGVTVYFVGSINVDRDGEPYIRCAYRVNGSWVEGDKVYLWTHKTEEHPYTPTIDEKKLGEDDLIAVLKMESRPA